MIFLSWVASPINILQSCRSRAGSVLGLINYDIIFKLVNFTIRSWLNVIVRRINYLSIKEYLSGGISLLLIPLFNDYLDVVSLLDCKEIFQDRRFHLRRHSKDDAICVIF
jgi:hypothetical protein